MLAHTSQSAPLRHLFLIVAVVAWPTFFVGCGGSDGPDLAKVEGTVTLNGSPLPNAVVQFQPRGGSGTYSTAITSPDGEFELRYSRDRLGARIGTHVVSVSTAVADDEDSEGKAKPVPELVPARYNSKSELIRDVKPGNNRIDLELVSATGGSIRR